MRKIKVGDTVTVHFTGTVERIGESGTGRTYVYVQKLWIAPEEYRISNEEEVND